MTMKIRTSHLLGGLVLLTSGITQAAHDNSATELREARPQARAKRRSTGRQPPGGPFREPRARQAADGPLQSAWPPEQPVSESLHVAQDPNDHQRGLRPWSLDRGPSTRVFGTGPW